MHIRARATALVNDDLLIDLGPDLFSAANRLRLYLGGLKVLLLTHRHEDHWLPQNLLWRSPGFTATPLEMLILYGPSDALDALTDEHTESAQLRYQCVRGGDQWQAAGYRITAIPATHGGGTLEGLLYVIEADGHRLFYATDTAPLGEAAWEVLRPLAPLDLILLDATSGHQSGGEAHHGMEQFLSTKAQFEKEGLLASGHTRLFAHHFSHNGGMTHPELVEAYGQHDVGVAYDGLTLDI